MVYHESNKAKESDMECCEECSRGLMKYLQNSLRQDFQINHLRLHKPLGVKATQIRDKIKIKKSRDMEKKTFPLSMDLFRGAITTKT